MKQAETQIHRLQKRALEKITMAPEGDHWLWSGAGSKDRTKQRFRVSPVHGKERTWSETTKAFPVMGVATSKGPANVSPAALWMIETEEEIAERAAHEATLNPAELAIYRQALMASIDSRAPQTDKLLEFSVKRVCLVPNCVNPAHYTKMLCKQVKDPKSAIAKKLGIHPTELIAKVAELQTDVREMQRRIKTLETSGTPTQVHAPASVPDGIDVIHGEIPDFSRAKFRHPDYGKVLRVYNMPDQEVLIVYLSQVFDDGTVSGTNVPVRELEALS